MKKIIIPVIATLLLGGCEFHDTYETYEVVKQGTDMFVDYIEAKSGDWHISGRVGDPGCYVYQEFIFDEITQNVLDKGVSLVLIVHLAAVMIQAVTDDEVVHLHHDVVAADLIKHLLGDADSGAFVFHDYTRSDMTVIDNCVAAA